jgi:putative endonuclease
VSRITPFLGNLLDDNLMEHLYHVYILASKSRVWYMGVTNNVASRLREHRNGTYSGFAEHYKTYRLLYYEVSAWVQDAIVREKQIKRWRREKKVFLIELANPTWETCRRAGQTRCASADTSCHVKRQQIPPLRSG